MSVKALLAAGLGGLLLAGCYAREPNYSNYGKRPHEWDLPGPDYETKVFGPMPYDQVKDFVRDKESSGWEIVSYEPASLPEDVMKTRRSSISRPARTSRRGASTSPRRWMIGRIRPSRRPSLPI